MPAPHLALVTDDGRTPWRFTHHALVRAAQRGFARDDVEAVLERPTLTYPQRRYGPHRHIVAGAGIAVAVDTATRTVITVLFDQLDPAAARAGTHHAGTAAA